MISTADLLGALQIHVMRHMWTLGTATVHHVVDLHNAELRQQGHPNLAYTTYLTVMRNLTRRGFLTQAKGVTKSHVFSPVITKQEYRSRVVELALEHFEGDAKALSAMMSAISG